MPGAAAGVCLCSHGQRQVSIDFTARTAALTTATVGQTPPDD